MGLFSKPTLAGVAVAFLNANATAKGDAPPVVVACRRLAGFEEEVEARVRLLFAERKRRPHGIELHCDARDAWVMWGEERLAVERRHPLSDAFLDAIDARLALVWQTPEPAPVEAAPEAESDGASAGDPSLAFASATAPTPQEIPQFDRPSPRPRKESLWPERYRPEGGLSMGLDFDSQHGDLYPSTGPRFELGVPVGLFTVLVAETARFGWTDSRSIMVMGVEAGAGFGAPYARGAGYGAALRVGNEWLMGYARNSNEVARTTWAPSVALGLRAAVDWRVVPWVGIDTRVRLSPLELGSPMNITLPQVSAMLTLGVAYLADVPDIFSDSDKKAKAPVAQGFRSLAFGSLTGKPDATQTP